MLDAIGQAIADIAFHGQSIHDHIDVVFQFFVERWHLVDFVERAIDFHALKAALLQILQILPVLTLAPPDNGRQQIKPRSFGQCHYTVRYLTDGLAFYRQSGRGRVGHTDTRKQQAQIVVNLGHRADR